jgi:putative inorganic carbon (HCO3(-)) transporter
MLSLALQSGVTFYTYVFQTGENVFGSLFGAAQSSQEARVGPSRGSGAAFVFEQGALRRGTGTIGTANLEAKYFVLLLPIALVAAVVARRTLVRAAAGGILVVGLAALYLTYSRGGLICALIALGLVPLLLARRGLWRPKAVVATAVTGLAALAVAAPVLVSFIGSRPGFTRTRFDQAIYGVQIWAANPVAGVGMNNFNTAVSPLAFDGTFSGSPIHNHYLRIGIETGVIGFVLYFGFFVWAVRLAWRLTAAADPFVAAVASGLCAALVGIGIYWVEDLFYDPIIRTQIWIAVALTAVLARMAAADPTAPRLRMLAAAGRRWGQDG